MSEKPPAVVCPYCGSAMFAGKSEVKGDFVSYMLAGFSMQDLWFQSDARKIRKKIMVSRIESPAHMCESCGTIAIPPAKTFLKRVKEAAREVSEYIEERKNQP